MRIGHIFSSDLQRAFKTAEAIREAQSPAAPRITRLESLREQDFGFFEGKQFFERPREGNKSGKEAHLEMHRNEPGFVDVESKESMRIRVESFIDDHLMDCLASEEHQAVAVVAHGIILSSLWRAFLKRFHPADVAITPAVQTADRSFSLEYLGGWSNTGYLELEIKPKMATSDASSLHSRTPSTAAGSQAPALQPQAPRSPSNTFSQTSLPSKGLLLARDPEISSHNAMTPVEESASLTYLNMTLVLRAVNSKEHLKGLKKTRGGIGSLKHDSSQKTMDSFFKKRRTE